MILAYIPSPGQGVWHLGPFPVRAYALCILAGVIVAIWLGNRRWIQRGGQPGVMSDIAVWAVPFGLVGARLYHVVTDPELYFDAGRNPWAAFYIWQGGLGIWGAIGLGALGAFIACRRLGIPLPAVADAAAPGIAFAQAIGRWGNYFNQELYGRHSTLPWALEIDPAHREPGMQGYATYQPTFLYESIWDVGTALLVIWADKRFKLGHGRAFAVYVMAYTVGRAWIEDLRVDTANHILGLRLNEFTAVILFLLAATYFVVSAWLRPGREVIAQPESSGEEPGDPSADVEAPAVDEGPETATEPDVVLEEPSPPDDPVVVDGADGVPVERPEGAGT